MKIAEKIKKIFKNGGLLILVAVATFAVVFSKMDIKSIADIFYNLDIKYIAAAIFCMLIVVVCEGINIKRCMSLFKEKTSILHCLYYSLTGVFFSSITPAATGGQPMQLCAMHKNKIKISNAALALLVCLASYQLVTVGVATVAVVVKFDFFRQTLGGFNGLLFIGLLANMLLFLLVLAAIFSKKIIYKIVFATSKIVAKFNAKKADDFYNSAIKEIERYKQGAAALKNQKGFMIKTVAITTAQILALHSMPFWVYKAMGLSTQSIVSMILIQAALYITGAAMPLPGAVGIGESGFLIFFKTIFPNQMLGAAMVASRGISFYFMLLISGVGILLFKAIKQKSKGRVYRLKTKLPQKIHCQELYKTAICKKAVSKNI